MSYQSARRPHRWNCFCCCLAHCSANLRAVNTTTFTASPRLNTRTNSKDQPLDLIASGDKLSPSPVCSAFQKTTNKTSGGASKWQMYSMPSSQWEGHGSPSQECSGLCTLASSCIGKQCLSKPEKFTIQTQVQCGTIELVCCLVKSMSHVRLSICIRRTIMKAENWWITVTIPLPWVQWIKSSHLQVRQTYMYELMYKIVMLN